MRQLLYTLHFRSRSRPPGREDEILHTAGSAASCVVRTEIVWSGLETEVAAERGGGFASFESDLRATGAGEFQEEGAITFGDDSRHLHRSSTLGEGHLIFALAPGGLIFLPE